MFLSSQYCCKHLQISILWSRGWEQLLHCATHLFTAKETTVSTYIPVYTTDGADVCILHNMYCTLTLVRPHFVELLQYANERKKIDPQAIEDIYNGCTYKCIESALSVGSVHLSHSSTPMELIYFIHLTSIFGQCFWWHGYFVKCIYTWLPARCALHLIQFKYRKKHVNGWCVYWSKQVCHVHVLEPIVEELLKLETEGKYII